ncbi:TonB-dependent receptor [candidate division WOR-3 bacterium]|nr:TonB-dependent receptor [candidate division WOR-3 bacterium]
MKRILFVALIGVFLFGAEFGRINGRVVDGETGTPLAGADVIVEGTDLGAATDAQGEFVVLYVPAGTYRITASYISYDPFTFTSVVVNADQTTTVNFRLPPTVIEVRGVTAVAEREAIVRDQVHTRRTVTSEEMSRLPVTTINQVIALQSGVVQSSRGTHLRGGREGEITYFVDGIVTKVPNTNWQSVIISQSAVEEVSVVSGGFDAEYGDALSGVVNIVTREGGAKISGAMNVFSDAMFSGWQDPIHYGYNLFDLSLGGPFPAAQRLRYFLSGEWMNTDSYHGEGLYKLEAPRQDYRAQGRLTYNFPDAKGKLSFTGFTERRQWVIYSGTSGTSQYNLKYFDNRPMSRIKNWILSSTFNYMLTAQTLASLKVGVTHFDRVYGNRDYTWEEENDRQWYEDYRFKAEHLVDMLRNPDGYGVTVRNVLIDSVMQYHTEYTNRDVEALRHNPYGVEGLFYTFGDYRVWRVWNNNDMQARFDVTHSVGKIHEFKSGVDFIRYEMQYYDNNLPWVANPFWDYYDRAPWKLAAYVQDKMDFEGLVARVGLRFDYFDPQAQTYEAPEDYQNNNLISSETQYRISPRLGFSLPVTDRMKLRFNYGQYFQLPALDNLYGSTDTSVVRLLISRGNAIVGNIMIESEKTVLYELGIENQLSDEVVFGFTAYFKDIFDLNQVREVVAIPYSYYQYMNVDYGSVKGFEVNLQKRMSNMWAFGLSYTLQFAKGTAADAYEWYSDHYYYQIDVPVIDYYLDFDQRHTMHANWDLSLPSDFFLIPLQDFASSIVFSYNSGQPYTPRDLKGNKLGDENSARTPGYLNVDWNMSRSFKLGPANLVLKGMIYNLFNSEQIIEVHETTGDPIWHGDPEPSLDQFGYTSIASNRYSPQADFNHDGLINPREAKQAYIDARNEYYNDPRNFLPGFRARIGVGLQF